MKYSSSFCPPTIKNFKGGRLTLLILAIISSQALLAQDENRFRNFHGIRHPENGVTFFEGEGNEIFIEHVDYGLNEKGISKIRKKYSIKDGQLSLDSVTNLKVLTRTEEKNGITAFSTYYLLPVVEDGSTVIGFMRAKTRDIGLERDFVNSYLANTIPSFVYTGLGANSIDFVGRKIEMGAVCRWMYPHNIQCPNNGQMNWALFDNLKQAEEYRDTYYEMAKDKNLVNIKEEKTITLKFEGQETKALRRIVKIQLPKLVMGGSNVLVVYYVTTYVRGKYVTCILSHYTDDAGANKLPGLLNEVLELME